AGAGPDLTEVTEANIIGPSEFGIAEQDYLRMATAYDVTELATAVKPYVLRELRRKGRDVVIYLDPDITVYRPMPEVAELARKHQLVLTPDRKSTRLNSSHVKISYAVFCLKKKNSRS